MPNSIVWGVGVVTVGIPRCTGGGVTAVAAVAGVAGGATSGVSVFLTVLATRVCPAAYGPPQTRMAAIPVNVCPAANVPTVLQRNDWMPSGPVATLRMRTFSVALSRTRLLT